MNEHLALKGGVETYLLSLMPMLKERGIEQLLAFGSGDPNAHHPSVQIPGIARIGFKNDRTTYEAVKQSISELRPDLIHVHNVKNVGALKACVEFKSVLMTTHDFRLICPASTFYYRRTNEMCTRTCGPGCLTMTLRKHCLSPRPAPAAYFYRRSNWFIKQGKSVDLIAPSQRAKERFLQAGFDSNKITVLPYFCPVKPLENPRPLPSEKIVTYMGRIAPSKGYRYFIEALGLLPQDVKGIMVGNFSEETEKRVTDLADKYGCRSRLELRGWATRDEVVNIQDRTSVFVFPSLWPETLGIVGIEAFARGVPVVASNIGGVTEWLIDGQNGFLAKPKSALEIKNGIEQILSSDEKQIAFGTCGIETINTKFLPQTHTDKLVALYEQVAHH